MVVPRSLASGDLLQAIRKAGKPLLETVELIDRFEGGQLSDDQCSQAFRLRYRGKDSTSPMSRFNRCTRRCAKRWSSNSRLSCAVDGLHEHQTFQVGCLWKKSIGWIASIL